jgi:hypothetical protein
VSPLHPPLRPHLPPPLHPAGLPVQVSPTLARNVITRVSAVAAAPRTPAARTVCVSPTILAGTGSDLLFGCCTAAWTGCRHSTVAAAVGGASKAMSAAQVETAKVGVLDVLSLLGSCSGGSLASVGPILIEQLLVCGMYSLPAPAWTPVRSSACQSQASGHVMVLWFYMHYVCTPCSCMQVHWQQPASAMWLSHCCLKHHK